MRRLLLCLALALLALTGCHSLRWPQFNPPDNRGPVPKEVPTAADLVAYLNSNSERLRTLRCEELEVTVSQGLQTISARGRLISEQPRNFRLGIDMAGAREVDLGSNQDEFWYWIKRGDNVQIHCSHRDLEAGNVKRMPFPFQPTTIMEALGMATFGPAEKYQVVVEADKLKLVERTRSPQGRAIKKVIVFNRRPSVVPTPQVTDLLILDDATGNTICSAHVRRAQLVTQTNGMLPRDFDLVYPEGKLKLALRLNQVSANFNIPAGSPAFVRAPMPGVGSFDLATGRMDSNPSSIQRVRGQR